MAPVQTVSDWREKVTLMLPEPSHGNPVFLMIPTCHPCCSTGYFTHVTTLAEVREQVQKYVPVLARPLVLSSVVNDTQRAGRLSSEHPVIWTGVYADIAVRRPPQSSRGRSK